MLIWRCARQLTGWGSRTLSKLWPSPSWNSGQLVRVLEDWSPSFEGLYLYYPGHRQVPATLRALIDMIRAARGSAPGRRPLQNSFISD